MAVWSRSNLSIRAAAAARILRLDWDHTAMAISLAASQAGGLRQNFGTMTKPFHAGSACRTGVTAAKLVQAGFTASQDAIEGRFGFIHAFSGGEGYEKEQVLQNLGNRCFLVESGIEVKKYPCCGSAHLALDAISSLMKGEKIDPDQIDSIEVKVDFDPPRSLIHSRPKTALEGKFSMEYCLAAALLDGEVGLRTFSDQQVLRPEAQSLIQKVQMRRIAGYEGQPSWTEAYNQVDVHLRDGRTLTEKAARITQGALRGVTIHDIRTKFRDCAASVLTHSSVEELVGLLDRLEEQKNISEVANLLRNVRPD